ncbi:MalM family protein [Psychromonas sp. MME2]|uniref:MalM family protein n=1 Tax=Psychromonas sp. MME2 TaxID=3231033 RepID=UPI00339C1DE0
MKNLPFQLAPLENTIQVDITEKSPVVNFPEGKSYVAPLMLSSSLNQFTFELESLIGRSVFVPSVLFLDENLQKVAQMNSHELITDEYLRMKREFSEELATKIRYIVVYTRNELLDSKTELPNPRNDYDIALGMQPEDMKKFYAKNSALGHLNVKISNVFFAAPAVLPTTGESGIKSAEHDNVTLSVKKTAIDPLPQTVGTSVVESKSDIVAQPTAIPTILPDTEAFYLKQITIAVKEDNLARAWSLVEEAQRAGSTKAKEHYKKEIKNLN